MRIVALEGNMGFIVGMENALFGRKEKRNFTIISRVGPEVSFLNGAL